jgi:hypothetical protein
MLHDFNYNNVIQQVTILYLAHFSRSSGLSFTEACRKKRNKLWLSQYLSPLVILHGPVKTLQKDVLILVRTYWNDDNIKTSINCPTRSKRQVAKISVRPFVGEHNNLLLLVDCSFVHNYVPYNTDCLNELPTSRFRTGNDDDTLHHMKECSERVTFSTSWIVFASGPAQLNGLFKNNNDMYRIKVVRTLCSWFKRTKTATERSGIYIIADSSSRKFPRRGPTWICEMKRGKLPE